jgi:hypothetical protein
MEADSGATFSEDAQMGVGKHLQAVKKTDGKTGQVTVKQASTYFYSWGF